MKWYFTPSLGAYGAAIEIDANGNVGRIAFANINQQGLIFVKWAPIEDKMCNPQGSVNVSSLILFEATGDHISKLNNMFSAIIPFNGKPRLIQ
jgi:hypothetical protein